MAKYALASFALLFCFLAGCGDRTPDDSSRGSPKPASALEQAALDAGVVVDASSVSPVGLYRKRHESGRDSLCVVPAKDGKLGFGLEAMYGRSIRCTGSGTLRSSGDKLIMNFARSACIIVAEYDGERIALPGAVDRECEKLCNARASLEGVSFPRVSRSAAVARDARDSEKEVLCP